ncbi:hypothetical protein ACFIQF_04865 [Comamonas sp. J-3]|uniref:hypothetical protein n=1 Tax=Comamonas trifloxystrobinivorans TaxID=3350256 RepID=UPI00372CE263
MHIAGIGLHVIVALFFAVHAVRSGQNNYWLFILFAFPLLGSVVYFFAIYLPNSRLQRHARQLANNAVKALDPTREVREAQAAYDYSPTAQNEIRLAQALLAVGDAQKSLKHFEAAMKGPFATDQDIRWSAAQAAYEAGQPQTALQYLKAIAQTDVNYRVEPVGLLIAKSYAMQGDQEMARKSFDFVRQQSGGFDVIAEYAIWAAERGDWATAHQLKAEADKAMTHWSGQQRMLNKEMLFRLKQAFAKQPK